MKQVVVFGGSGFIGSHFVKALSRMAVQEIIIADIRTPQVSVPPGATFKYCDVRKPIPLEIARKPDLVINLAAIAREPGFPDKDYFDTNAGGAESIVRYCEDAGTDIIWFTSSMSVYGPKEEPCPETGTLTPVTAYGKSKVLAEQIHCEWFARSSGRRLLTVRPAVIFGARENGNFTRLAKTLKRGLFVYPGRSDTIKACGYVDDLIDSMFFMDRQNEDYLLYNFCYPAQHTIKDICMTFCRVAGFRQPLGTFPQGLMFAAAGALQFLNSIGLKNTIHPMRIYKLVHSTNIIPAELQKRGYLFQTNLEEGLRRWLEDEPEGEFL